MKDFADKVLSWDGVIHVKILLDEFIKNHPQLKDSSTLIDFGGVISVGAPINEFVKDNFLKSNFKRYEKMNRYKFDYYCTKSEFNNK